LRSSGASWAFGNCFAFPVARAVGAAAPYTLPLIRPIRLLGLARHLPSAWRITRGPMLLHLILTAESSASPSGLRRCGTLPPATILREVAFAVALPPRPL